MARRRSNAFSREIHNLFNEFTFREATLFLGVLLIVSPKAAVV